MNVKCPGCGNPIPPGRLKWCSRDCYERMQTKSGRRVAPPVLSFSQGYLAALAAGVDLLEQGDAVYECRHGRLGCGECAKGRAA